MKAILFATAFAAAAVPAQAAEKLMGNCLTSYGETVQFAVFPGGSAAFSIEQGPSGEAFSKLVGDDTITVTRLTEHAEVHMRVNVMSGRGSFSMYSDTYRPMKGALACKVKFQ